MAQTKIRIKVEGRNKLESALLRFQKVTTLLRKRCKAKRYFTKKKKVEK